MLNSLSKRDIICLVAIIVFASVIRFWNLGSLPLVGDESYHFLSSSAIHEHGIPIMESGLVYTRGLPLLYMQAASTAIFGDNVMALRIPSAIIGVFTVFMTFMFFRIKIPSASLLIALMIAISPLTVYYSRNARMYELLLVSSLTLWTILEEWKRTNHIRYLIGTLLLIIFIIPVHGLSIIPLFGIVIPSILNPRLSLTTRIYLTVLQLVSFAAWFGYYKLLLRIIFPTPEHLLSSGKSSIYILPDSTLPLQIFNSSPVISSLILTLGLLLIRIVLLF